ncbi:MAG: glycosyltransferase [Muribaculaceae bacterium]|nr:glycosyltransferase [Muribaculaceae bacterium]
MISIIVPIYNTKDYLKDCIRSIRNQTISDWEAILIDDGSTDESSGVAMEFVKQDPRIKYFKTEHKGLSNARNLGIQKASGDLLFFLDSDDLINPELLKIQQELIRNEHACIVSCKLTSNFQKATKAKLSFKKKLFSAEKAIESTLYQREISSSMCGKLFKKVLFDNLQFTKGIFYEDLDIFYRVFEKCNKIVNIDFPGYFYRKRQGSILSEWNNSRLNVLEVTENIEKYIRKNYPTIVKAAIHRRFSANCNMFLLSYQNGITLDQCWQIIRKYRASILADSQCRLKNKAGALISYFGPGVFLFFSRFK